MSRCVSRRTSRCMTASGGSRKGGKHQAMPARIDHGSPVSGTCWSVRVCLNYASRSARVQRPVALAYVSRHPRRAITSLWWNSRSNREACTHRACASASHSSSHRRRPSWRLGCTSFRSRSSHLFTPNIMRRQTDVPQTPVLFAVIAGAAIGGVVGIVASIPVAAAMRAFLRRSPARGGRRSRSETRSISSVGVGCR